MYELALFAGAGGGILGSHLAGWRTVAAVEIDAYCRGILLKRQDEGHLPPFPVWDDVRTFDGRPLRGLVDLVSAGFPCQPFSLAGKRLADDDPANMWPDTIRVIREVRPRFALLENVPGLLAGSHGYFGEVLRGLAESGFDAWWCVLSAAGEGAPHLRRRLWIVAHSDKHELRAQQEPREERKDTARPWDDGEAQPMADPFRDTHRQGRQGSGASRPASDAGWWATEPDVGRVAHGVAHRVDRLRAIGNGQVPGVVLRVLEEAGLTIEGGA